MSLCPSWLCAPHCLAPRSCTHRVALPLATACPVSPCPLWLHALHCSSSCDCMHHIALPLAAAHTTLLWPLCWLIICLYTFFFPFFSTNFLFCSQLLCLNGMMVMWP